MSRTGQVSDASIVKRNEVGRNIGHVAKAAACASGKLRLAGITRRRGNAPVCCVASDSW